MLLYYRDILELGYSIIDINTFLYLVYDENRDMFFLNAINKNHLDLLYYDPYTRSEKYWPISLNSLIELAGNKDALSKFFYYESDLEIQILAHRYYTRREVNYYLKVDPITDPGNIKSDEEKKLVVSIKAQNFAVSGKMSIASFKFKIKENILREVKVIEEEITKLADIFEVQLYDSDILRRIIYLNIIIYQCEYIKEYLSCLCSSLQEDSNHVEFVTKTCNTVLLKSSQQLNNDILVYNKFSNSSNTNATSFANYQDSQANTNCFTQLINNFSNFFKNATENRALVNDDSSSESIKNFDDQVEFSKSSNGAACSLADSYNRTHVRI